MSDLKKISSTVDNELKEFNRQFSLELKSNVPLLNIITKYLLRTKGKQIRPLLVLLSAKLNGNISESTYVAASLIELLHTATLVHDDVVDESYERRGFLSINALWKSKIAVLIGDYLLSKGLLLAIRKKEYSLLEIVSDAVKEMSEGELMQIKKSRKLNITEEEYIEIITKKTATLIASCTTCGARSVSTDPELISNMYNFGINLGIAFQIKDDLFDYELSNSTGKPKGNDIKEKKITLPLIKSLQTAPKSEGRTILKLINSKSQTLSTQQQVLDFVNKYGGVLYAQQKMNHYKTASLTTLDNFPDNDIKLALQDLVNFVINRSK